MRQDQWQSVYSILLNRRAIKVQTTCLSGLKKGYLKGTTKEDELPTQLQSIGIPGDDVWPLINAWKCEKQTRPKSETAAMICKYLENEIVDYQTAKQLLVTSGYTNSQASRILRNCLAGSETGGKKKKGKAPQPPKPIAPPPAK